MLVTMGDLGLFSTGTTSPLRTSTTTRPLAPAAPAPTVTLATTAPKPLAPAPAPAPLSQVSRFVAPVAPAPASPTTRFVAPAPAAPLVPIITASALVAPPAPSTRAPTPLLPPTSSPYVASTPAPSTSAVFKMLNPRPAPTPSALTDGAREILATVTASSGPIVAPAPLPPPAARQSAAPPPPSALTEGAKEILATVTASSGPIVAPAPELTRVDPSPFVDKPSILTGQQPTSVIDQAHNAVQTDILTNPSSPYYVDPSSLTAPPPGGAAGGGGGFWPGDAAPAETYVEPTIIPGVPNIVFWGGLAAVGLYVGAKFLKR
jgi:hypothetical protein